MSNEDIQKDITFLSGKIETSELRKRYKDALKLNQLLTKEIEAINCLKQVDDNYVVLEKKRGSSEATAVIMASDWHIEELVNPLTINGLNEFNLTIAKQRIDCFFTNSVKLIKIFQKDIKINNIILWLGGDLISGNIHDELMENTCLRPIEAIKKAQEFLIGGIHYILKNTNCSLIIPCNSGNHSRITAKTHISTEQGNSLESYMYYNIANYFSHNKRVKFLVSNGYHLYLQVYNYQLRFHHGHELKYNGGVRGLYEPVNKAIAGWNKGKVASLDCFGHFHTRLDGGSFLSNGSLIGYTAYALSLKASYEEPSQAFFLLDKEMGKSIVAPIFLR